VYNLAYTRRKKINPNDQNARVDFVDDMGDKWQEYTVKHRGFKQWMEIARKKNSKDSPYHLATAREIDWEASVDLQASAQKWICHAISKTCNLPEDVSKDVVSKVYMRAWESGCKGFTVYREGSRSGVLISGDNAPDRSRNKFVETHAPRRPEDVGCDIYHMSVRSEKWNIFVGLFDDRPYEIFAGRADFVDIPKSRKSGVIKKDRGKYSLHIGEDENEIVIKNLSTVFDNPTESAFTRTVSLALRHGAPIQYVVEQIEKGASKDSDMFSLAKGLMRVLKNYIKNGTKASLKQCPQCGSEEVAYQEGCISCVSCGWSKCS
jgi:ribonucleoside-diphosphate reductase alpha chain